MRGGPRPSERSAGALGSGPRAKPTPLERPHGRSRSEILTSAAMAGQGIVPIVAFALSDDVVSPYPTSPLVNQLLWLLITGVTACAIINSPRRQTTATKRIFIAAFALVFVAQALSVIWSGSFPPLNPFVPPVLTAVLLRRSTDLPMPSAARIAALSLYPVLAASLAAGLLGDSRAFNDEAARIPFAPFEYRLQGVTPHPNSLGLVAALGLCLTFALPRRLRLPTATLSAWALLASDSRAMIIAAMIGLVVAAVSPLLRLSRRSVGLGFVLASFVVIGASVALNPLASWMADSDRSLNGRTKLWSEALVFWRESPVMGVGPRAFDEAFRVYSGLSFAGQAHNQFLQSLAAQGLLGLTVLGVLVVAGVNLSMFGPRSGRSATSSLFVVLAMNLLVESPLRASRWSIGLLAWSAASLIFLAERNVLLLKPRR